MRKAKIGNLVFDVISSESIDDTAEITDKPVERGGDISDHFKPAPTILDISGAFTGKDAPKQLQQLLKMYADGNLVTYVGRNAYANVVIKDLQRGHNQNNRLGFDFTMTLQRVKIAQSQEFSVKAKPPPAKPVVQKKKSTPKKTNTQTKKRTTRGRQQPRPKKTSTTNQKFIGPKMPVKGFKKTLNKFPRKLSFGAKKGGGTR